MVIHFWGRCQSRIGFRFGSLANALFSFSLLFHPCAVFADSIPYAADIGYAAFQVTSGNFMNGVFLPTQDAACELGLIDPRTSAPIPGNVYSHFTYTIGLFRGECWYTTSSGTYSNYPDGGWSRQLACPRGGLPDRAADVPMCSCPPGQEFPSAPDWLRGPWCVLATTPSCLIDPIPPYTPDPEPVDITAPNFRLGTQLACMQNAIGASNGTSRVNSGYRSAPYNEHLQKVWDRWRELLLAQRPECAAELATATNHKNRHELVARPANSSDHTRGEAFDLSSGLYDGILDVLGFGCGLRRPNPIGDPPHFIRR